MAECLQEVVARREAEVERCKAEVPLSRGEPNAARGQEAAMAQQQGQRNNQLANKRSARQSCEAEVATQQPAGKQEANGKGGVSGQEAAEC